MSCHICTVQVFRTSSAIVCTMCTVSCEDTFCMIHSSVHKGKPAGIIESFESMNHDKVGGKPLDCISPSFNRTPCWLAAWDVLALVTHSNRKWKPSPIIQVTGLFAHQAYLLVNFSAGWTSLINHSAALIWTASRLARRGVSHHNIRISCSMLDISLSNISDDVTVLLLARQLSWLFWPWKRCFVGLYNKALDKSDGRWTLARSV